jgi:hypothetical protein
MKVEMEEKYDNSLSNWKDACLPLKLSIEIMANAFALRDDEVNNTIDDYDEMAWDSDQEEKHLAEVSVALPFCNLSKDDERFVHHIVTLGIPDRLLSVFGSIFMVLVNSGKSNETTHFEIFDDLTDVLSKCSVCLGNMFCTLQNTWKNEEHKVITVWNDLIDCLKVAKDESMNKKTMLPVISAALSVMVALVRFYPTLVACMKDTDVEVILSFVLIECPEDGKNQEETISAVSDIQKDSIVVLGLISSVPHPENINEYICDTLLTLLLRTHSITTSVMSEILNVLMDMYSADEGDANNHEKVFKRKDVLAAFQKSVPILKRKVREDEGKQGVSKEEIFEWKEIILNATRFIKYKKGQ